jgi:hypothetical protein
MTNNQAHTHKRTIGAEVVEEAILGNGQHVWLFYSADGKRLDCRVAK